MWELNHPFPYQDKTFIKETLKLETYFLLNNYSNVIGYYQKMKKYLNEIDYEYMIWQQWKEGFARYIETLIREEFSISTNTSIIKPFNRECFYTLGSEYIRLLFRTDNKLKCNLKKLYTSMYNIKERI